MMRNRRDSSQRELIVFLCMLMLTSKIIPFGYAGFFPDLTLSILYVWSIYYSNYTHVIILFFMSLLFDLIGGRVIGMGAFLWTSWFAILFGQKRFISSSNIILCWGGFAIFAVLYHVSEWVFLKPFFFLPLHFDVSNTALEIALFPMIFKMILVYERSKTTR